IVIITVAVIVGKVVACSAGAFVCGNDQKTSMRVGMGLAQIGEFSFIIAQLGTTLKVTSDFLYPIAVAVSALTTLFTPYLIRAAEPLARRMHATAPHGLRRTLQMYTSWLQSLRFVGDQAVIAKMVRRILLQAFVNFCLVAAIFGGGAYLASAYMAQLSAFVPNRALANALIWGGA